MEMPTAITPIAGQTKSKMRFMTLPTGWPRFHMSYRMMSKSSRVFETIPEESFAALARVRRRDRLRRR